MPISSLKRFAIGNLPALLIIISVSGCASLGEKVDFADSERSIPEIDQILQDLDSNDRLVHSFQGRGIFILESPEFDGKRKFRGNLKFQRPASLYVQGAKLGGAIIVFRMISLEQQFLMEFPGDKEQSFYQIEGQEFEDIPFSVSPSDIAREMFLPETWGEVRKRSMTIISFDQDTGILVVEMTQRRRIHRRLELQQLDADAPRWVITRNIRFDSNGEILATTTLENFTRVGETLFPGKVDAYFPTEDTRMTFTMRNIRLNTDIDPFTFDILARARELNLQRRSADSPDP